MNIIFLVILVFVAYQDAGKMEIKNKYILMITVLSIFSIFFTEEISFTDRLWGALCVSFPMLLIAVIRPGILGGGDIKLMAAGGLYMGWYLTLRAVLIAIVAATIYAGYLLLIKHKDYKTKIPLGPFLCVGMALSQIRN